MTPKTYLSYWKEHYQDDLVGNVLPFWFKYGIDKKNGGIYTCLDRDGSLMDSTKSVWFQGRWAFVCAYAYNTIERREEWLEASRDAINFIEQYCIDPDDGRMYFEVTAEGIPLRKRRYVFSESFAAIAFAEFALASGETRYAERALELFKAMRKHLSTPGALPAKYLPSLESRGHSITMIMINVASRLKKVINDPILDIQIEESIHDLKHYFMHPEYAALLEMVGPKGEVIDTNQGRTINPGHCIETAWFLFDVAKERGDDKDLIDMGLTILEWSWAWGWDKEFGGLINFRDCKGLPHQEYSQDMKFWWPQTEGIIATLYAYTLTHNERYLRMHEEISQWAYTHMVDSEFGEWYGYLHRDGSVAQTAKGNLFKGPFHIPRMLIKGYDLCDKYLSL